MSSSKRPPCHGAARHPQPLRGPARRAARLGSTHIYTDINATGCGWFVDPTPADDSEFNTPGNQGEMNRMDLLTVLEHEIGHLLGDEHTDSGLMSPTLATGIRETPTAVIDQFFAGM